MELSNLSLSELRALQADAAAEMKKRDAENMASAREQILKIAQEAGIPLKELMKNNSLKFKGSDKGTVAVKYRHPENHSLQWTGRGRQPRWVKEWVEGKAGRSIDNLKV